MKISLDISLTEKEAKKLYDIMPDEKLKRFVFLHYIENKTISVCAREMILCEKQIYRIHNDVKNYAMKILLERLVGSEVKA